MRVPTDQAIMKKLLVVTFKRSLAPKHITLSLEQYSSPVHTVSVPLIPCDSQAIYIPGNLY